MNSTLAFLMLAVMVTVAQCVDIEKVNPPKKGTDSISMAITHIMIVIDSDRLTDDFQGKPVSKNPELPTGINHSYAFMITANKSVISGQATADLNISAIVGDVINWYGVSESNNFDNQIIVYKVKHSSKSLSEVRTDTMRKEYVFPRTHYVEELEAVKMNNYVISATVLDSGIVNYDVQFGVYTTNRGNGKRELFGYFTWDPVITIH